MTQTEWLNQIKRSNEAEQMRSWMAHCADQERAIEARDREIAALREALDLSGKTIRELRAQMSDPPQGGDADAADKAGRAADDPIIDKAIDRLGTRQVSQPDRGKLRDALDKADAPIGGREGMDQALGRAIRLRAPLSAMDWAR